MAEKIFKAQKKKIAAKKVETSRATSMKSPRKIVTGTQKGEIKWRLSAFYRDTVDVQPMAGYKLLLTFGDGQKGVFDCNPYRKYEFMADVWKEDVFNKVVADHGTVMWPGGEDLCPDDLYDNAVRV